MSQTIKPAPTFLFCEPIEVENKSASGLIFSDKEVEVPSQAKIINTGSHVKLYESGDTILYRNYAAVEIELGSIGHKDKYIMIDSEDVIGTVLEIKE